MTCPEPGLSLQLPPSTCPRWAPQQGGEGQGGPCSHRGGGHFKKEPGCSFTHSSCWLIAKAAQVWSHSSSAHLSLLYFYFLMLFTSLTPLSSSTEPFLIKQQIVKFSICQTETSVEATSYQVLNSALRAMSSMALSLRKWTLQKLPVYGFEEVQLPSLKP